jgi:structure-specific recognition protein 1
MPRRVCPPPPPLIHLTSLVSAALSAYNYFCSKIRQQIKEEMPSIANTDIMKEAATRWKALSADDRLPYEQLAHEDKAR